MEIKKKLSEWKKGNPIKKFRKDKGLSQPDVASLLGVSTYTVQRWEDGSVNPSGDNENKLNELIVGFDDEWKDWKKKRPTV